MRLDYVTLPFKILLLHSKVTKFETDAIPEGIDPKTNNIIMLWSSLQEHKPVKKLLLKIIDDNFVKNPIGEIDPKCANIT